MSCPSSGNPEPLINWFNMLLDGEIFNFRYKDGELLKSENVSKKIPFSKIEANELLILKVQLLDGGRYTCEGQFGDKNKLFFSGVKSRNYRSRY